MKTILFNIITLDWIIPDDNSKISPKGGVYQIYGDHPIYGQNILLYIGKADNLHARFVGGHLANEESFITRQPNISFRYALVDKEQIDIVEQILIVMHKPSFNSAHIININKKFKEEAYYIQNHGERSLLHLEVTNYYFLSAETIEKYSM
jgi:excinuclease UvrABC nuclease subunit